MTSQVFNTPQETAARLAIALAEIHEAVDLDVLATTDLIATYLKFFNLGERNLHGDSPYVIQEYDARRARVREGINLLVRTGKAQTNSGGTLFLINQSGTEYAHALQSTYASEYREAINVLREHDLSSYQHQIAQMRMRHE